MLFLRKRGFSIVDKFSINIKVQNYKFHQNQFQTLEIETKTELKE